jgi:hypothetical protein
MYVCIYVCFYVRIYVFIYLSIYVFMYVCMCLYTYVCMFVCTRVFIMYVSKNVLRVCEYACSVTMPVCLFDYTDAVLLYREAVHTPSVHVRLSVH